MANFQAQEREREVAADAAAAALKPYRVPSEAVEYGGRAHLYRCVLKGKDAPKTAVELTAPGAWDNCTLEPWDEIDVTYGRSPMDAYHGRLRVLAIPKQGLRRWERDAGLIERDHTVVAIVESFKQAAPDWGDEPPTEKDEGKIAKTGKS